MSIKTERLGNIFVKEISEVIREDVDNEDIKNVTILSVKVSGDLSYAKVYFTTLLDEKKEEIEKGLNNASSFIRGMLFDRVEIRKMPEFHFVYDTSIEYGNKIEQIIDEINKR